MRPRYNLVLKLITEKKQYTFNDMVKDSKLEPRIVKNLLLELMGDDKISQYQNGMYYLMERKPKEDKLKESKPWEFDFTFKTLPRSV